MSLLETYTNYDLLDESTDTPRSYLRALSRLSISPQQDKKEIYVKSKENQTLATNSVVNCF